MNTNVGQTELFGFSCKCPQGYTGEYCEIKPNSCLSNPCQNGGTCQTFGSLDYICVCQDKFSGVNCTEGSSLFTTRSTLVDFDQQLCASYKQSNLCDKNAYVNGKLVKEACPFSCDYQTSLSTTPKSSLLVDYDPASCSYFKSQGLCDKNAYLNGKLLKDACPESCGIQTVTTTSKPVTVCFDLYADFCANWSNFCIFLDSFPDHPCKKTCLKCF